VSQRGWEGGGTERTGARALGVHRGVARRALRAGTGGGTRTIVGGGIW
jgi:hypothetical protein